MDESFDTSFDTADTDFSSDVDTTDVDYDESDDVSDSSVDYTSYDTLDDVPDEAEIVEEDNNSDIETLDDIQEGAFVAEEEELEYKTLDDIPNGEDETIVDEQEIETLDDVEVEESLGDMYAVDDEEFQLLNINENPDESLSEINEEALMENSAESELQDDISSEMTDEVAPESTEFEAIELTQPEVVVEDSDATQDTNGLDAAIDRIMYSDLNPEHKKELLQNLRDEISQEDAPIDFENDVANCTELYNEEQDINNFTDDDPPKILKRDLTDEELLAKDRDTEEILDNYRENLGDYGVDEEKIEKFINQERDKINAEYESLDNGDTSSNVYHMPTNWEDIASELKSDEGNSEPVDDEQITEAQDINDISGWLGDINPNFDEFDPESPYCNNCGSCAWSVYNRLNGNTDMCASAENIGYNEEMNELTGMEQVSISPDEIESRLLAEGDGAHAIIGIDRAEGPGHWFNAACVDGKVVAIDGQTGKILDWPPDYGNVVNWEMSIKKGDK